LKVPGDYFYNISNIMIRLSTQNCISYAELCDTYGFYEQADFYEKLVNTKVAANNGLGISNQSWIKNDDIAEKAMRELGIKPLIKPIRGGTDGSQLSYMGLPCPNIFAGGHNFHGKYEYVPVESMQKAIEVIVKIAQLTATTDFNKKK
jgi:di/tripeptidase